MARNLLIFTLMLISSLAQAQTDTTFNVKESTYDFGKIMYHQPATHDFEIYNSGNKPLVILTVSSTCGCTTPEWDTKPIQPGETGIIKVGYNATSHGNFHKQIIVTYNKMQTKSLTIKGFVYDAPDNPAPENKSIALLNNIN